MTIQTRNIDYHDNDTLLQGHLAWDDIFTEPRACVLVAHTWAGRNDFACQQARKLATLGYIGFALDMYGKNIVGHTPNECLNLMQPLMDNRKHLQKRMLAALTTARQQNEVDPQRIAVIGFCFGGLCGLDLARTGINFSAAICVHGLLTPPDNISTPSIQSKILILHGHDDPLVSATEIAALQTELTAAHADWQMHIYGNTQHAFTNPQANNSTAGTVYQPISAHRAWQNIQTFLAEAFS